MYGSFTGTITGFLALSIVHVLVLACERAIKRQSLESDFDTAMVAGAEGMADYAASLKRRLWLLICIIPMIAVAVTVYVVNLK
ncbi:hypothetical protein [Rhodovulum euryhalinum]|uniref:Uncharacterized protein n=1 Tax=Rhodovulum euryhalinum TaxID=35805 RepID=A0A4R2KGL5_9RHOB|nr:hypothetical protein [Rhodovulum euryhalinum]TCO69118.1 hypothetical protein EV655_11832 [Rhodovulum euryhalinum]